jgi:hypothetical protein
MRIYVVSNTAANRRTQKKLGKVKSVKSSATTTNMELREAKVLVKN